MTDPSGRVIILATEGKWKLSTVSGVGMGPSCTGTTMLKSRVLQNILDEREGGREEIERMEGV